MNNKKLISIAIVALFVFSAFAVFGSLPSTAGASNQQTAAPSSIATSLGNSTATSGSSVGVTIPHAINKNYTQTPPVIIGPISYAPNYVTVGEPIIFSVGSANGGLPPYTYAWTFSGNGMKISATGQSVVESFTLAGKYNAVATVTDGINQMNSTNVTINVLGTLSISVTPSATHVKTGTPVNFAYAIHGGKGPYRVIYNSGNGSAPGHMGNSTKTAPMTGFINATYSLPGNYRALFVVFDFGGASASTVYNINVTNSTTIITTIPPLKVSAYYELMVYEGSSHNLYVNISGGTGYNNLTVNWGYNNTSFSYSAKGFVVMHNFTIPYTYATQGLYTITVIVKDSQGAIGTVYVPVDVSYVPPTVKLGYVLPLGHKFDTVNTSNITNATTLTLNLTQARAGVDLIGNISNGAPSYTWNLTSTTGHVWSGTQSTPDTLFSVHFYNTTIPGTHDLTLAVKDSFNNTAYANLTIIVTTTLLSVVLMHSSVLGKNYTSGSVQYPIDSTVYFSIYIHNVKISSNGTTYLNVTWSNATTHSINKSMVIIKGTAGAVILLYTSDSLNFTGTYKSLGKYNAFATVNYGKTFSNATGAPNHYDISYAPITIVRPVSVSFTVSVVPTSRTMHAGSPALVYVNVTGGNGVYELGDMFSGNLSGNIYLNGTQLKTEKISVNDTAHANITPITTPKAPYSFDFTFYVVYTVSNSAGKSYTMTFDVNDTTYANFHVPYKITFIVTPALPLEISLAASTSVSYASYTNFTLWVNVSGEMTPYSIVVNFGGLLVREPAVLVNTSGNYTLTYHNTPKNTSITITYKKGPNPVSFELTGVNYTSVSNYSLSNHEIVATANSTVAGVTYFVSAAYDEYAIPYVSATLPKPLITDITAPGVVTFDVNAIFGEFPNMHNYTYSWYENGKFLINTTSSGMALMFPSSGTYTVNVTVTAPNGEVAHTGYRVVTVSPSFEIEQVMSLRVLATMTNQTSGQSFIMNAGPADWAANGTLYASLTVPQTNTGNYTLNVSYSYTLEVTNFVANPEVVGAYASIGFIVPTGYVYAYSVIYGSWESYAANAYSTTGYHETMHVLSPTSENGQLSSVVAGIATIETKLGTLQASVNGLNASISSVHNNVVELKTSLGYISTNLSAMNATVTSTSSKLLGSMVYVNSTFGTLSGKITSISSGVATIGTSVGNLNVTTNEIKTKVDSLSSAPSDDLLFLIVVVVLVVITLALVTVLYGRVNKLSKASEQLNKEKALNDLNKQPPQNKQ